MLEASNVTGLVVMLIDSLLTWGNRHLAFLRVTGRLRVLFLLWGNITTTRSSLGRSLIPVEFHRY